MATNPLSAFFEGFQGARQNVQARQQQQVENELSQQLRQIQLMRAQQEISQQPMQQALLAEQLRKAMMTPEQVALENAKASYIQRQATQPGVIFQEGGPVEEITPAAQNIIDLRQTAADYGALPFTREGISGIEMQTAVPGLPGAVRSPAALRQEQEQARTNAAFKRALEGPTLKEVGDTLLRVPETGAPEVLFSATKPKDLQLNKMLGDDGQFHQVWTDKQGNVVRDLGVVPETEMKPSEVISSRNEIRNTYEKLPSKLDYFGSGQIRGSGSLKEDLDAVLNSKSVNKDFNKLTGTASDYFITRMNKLSDPTSATLIAEADRIAGRVGVGDQLITYFKGLKTGQKVSPEIAKQVYDVISSVEARQRENLINSLIPFDNEIKMLGKDLSFIGVPVDIQKEVERRIKSATTPSTGGAGSLITTQAQFDVLPPGTRFQEEEGGEFFEK